MRKTIKTNHLQCKRDMGMQVVSCMAAIEDDQLAKKTRVTKQGKEGGVWTK